MPARRPVLLTAAARVIARAAAIQLEDAAAAAGPVAVRQAQAAQAQAQAAAAQAAAQRRAPVTSPAGGDNVSFADVASAAANAQAGGPSAGSQVTSEMYPAPSWRKRPPREPDYGRRQPRAADAPTIPLASASTPLAGARVYGGREDAQPDVAEEDNDPHDLTAFSLSDPLDLPADRVRKVHSEDNDPHDLSAATKWSLSDPLDAAAQPQKPRYKPKPFKPAFIEGEDNDPHDLSASTRWSLSDPMDVEGARELKRIEEDNDPHDLSAGTRWSMCDPLDLQTGREFQKLSSKDGEEDHPQDLSASTSWSLGDPTDQEMLARKKYQPPEFKPVFVDRHDSPGDLTASTMWSMSDPVDVPASRKVKSVPKAGASRSKAVAEDEENHPQDLSATTRWSLGDPTDHEMLERKKYQPPEFKPVYVDKHDSPGDLTAQTMWSMSDPLDFSGSREVKSISKDEASSHGAAAVEEDHPQDLMASTRWSLGDPTDQEILARSKQTSYKPPEFKPVFVGREDVGLGGKRDEVEPHDLHAATRFSMSDPLDFEPVRKVKGEPTATEAAPAPAAEPTTLEQSAPASESTPPVEATVASASAIPTEPAPIDPEASLPQINVGLDEQRVALRSSTVPTSRLGRLFHYGSLGLSLGLGAATETIRRTAGGTGTGSVFMSEANVRRLVATLGRMRGAALKLGQFMSIQDNTMLPPEIERVLQQVQDHANYMPEWQMEKVLRAELGNDWESLFAAFDRVPVAAASIGQVHRATLKDGTPVAVKIQFPGVAGSISSDLANVSLLLRGSAVLPKGLYLQNTIAVAKRELEDECDYVREGAAGARFHRLLKDDPVFEVPRVIDECTTGKVLTTQWMGGRPLSKMRGMSQEQRDLIGSNILRLCLQELFQFRFMQTDPNWANFLFDAPTGRIQLIDFGASREYTKEFMDGWYRLLQAALSNDRAAMKAESESLGYLTGEEEDVMVNAHLDSMRALASPFRHDGKFEFAKQTITDEVRALIPVMLQHRLTPPPAPTYSLNRKLSGAFLMCAKLGANVDCKKLWEEVVGGYQLGPDLESEIDA